MKKSFVVITCLLIACTARAAATRTSKSANPIYRLKLVNGTTFLVDRREWVVYDSPVLLSRPAPILENKKIPKLRVYFDTSFRVAPKTEHRELSQQLKADCDKVPSAYAKQKGIAGIVRVKNASFCRVHLSEASGLMTQYNSLARIGNSPKTNRVLAVQSVTARFANDGHKSAAEQAVEKLVATSQGGAQ